MPWVRNKFERVFVLTAFKDIRTTRMKPATSGRLHQIRRYAGYKPR
jgi:hypothetical protein